MAIEKINSELCNGCGLCVESCPADVIRLSKETGKAYIRYLEDCATCLGFKCLTECPKNAITMSIGKSAPLFTSWG